MGRLGVAVRTTLEPTVAPGTPSLIFSALLSRGSQYPFLPWPLPLTVCPCRRASYAQPLSSEFLSNTLSIVLHESLLRATP